MINSVQASSDQLSDFFGESTPDGITAVKRIRRCFVFSCAEFNCQNKRPNSTVRKPAVIDSCQWHNQYLLIKGCEARKANSRG